MRIWSENKYVDYLINALLFLVAVNFLHYGQFILPLICLVLFVDNHFRFNFGNIFTFAVLCLFGISFFVFSYKMGFYAVMGFCCPMAYYIGTNMKYVNEESVKKIIYILALGMATHVILNGIYDLNVHYVSGNMYSSHHYDFWTKERMSSTATALNMDVLIGSLYYIFTYEKKKMMKIMCFIAYVVGMLYCVYTGRRTPILLTLIVVFASFIYEGYVHNSLSEKVKKIFIVSFGSLALLALVIGLSYYFNFLNCQVLFDKFYIIYKFKQGLLDNSRISAYVGAVKLMPEYMWGGQLISAQLNNQVHELWLDIYDYAGAVPWFMMLIYTVMCIKNMLKVLFSKKAVRGIKTLSIGLFIAIGLQMFLEPVMTGASIFLMVAIIIFAVIERIAYEF